MSLGAGTYNPFSASFRDKGGEIGTFSVYGPLIVEADFDDDRALATTFNAKLNAATLGQEVAWEYGIQTIVNPSAKASSASAQRENKLLVRYHDDTTLAVLTASIPTIDLPNLAFENDANDFVDMTTPAMISELKTAWEAFVVNPATGNGTIVDSMEYVGRNR